MTGEEHATRSPALAPGKNRFSPLADSPLANKSDFLFTAFDSPSNDTQIMGAAKRYMAEMLTPSASTPLSQKKKLKREAKLAFSSGPAEEYMLNRAIELPEQDYWLPKNSVMDFFFIACEGMMFCEECGTIRTHEYASIRSKIVFCDFCDHRTSLGECMRILPHEIKEILVLKHRTLLSMSFAEDALDIKLPEEEKHKIVENYKKNIYNKNKNEEEKEKEKKEQKKEEKIKKPQITDKAPEGGKSEEVHDLKLAVQALMADNKALREEIWALKNLLSEPRGNAAPAKSIMSTSTESQPIPDKSRESVSSFVSAVKTHAPNVVSNKTKMATEAEAAAVLNGTLVEASKTYSPLKIVFFKGCQRSDPKHYRRLLAFKKYNHALARDICFLTEDIMQVVTYESEISKILQIFKSVKPSVELLENFDPCDPANFVQYGNFDADRLKECYFNGLKNAMKRLTEMCLLYPNLTRTVSFIKKVIETKCVNYSTPKKAERSFFMNSYINFKSLEATVTPLTQPPVGPAADVEMSLAIATDVAPAAENQLSTQSLPSANEN